MGKSHLSQSNSHEQIPVTLILDQKKPRELKKNAHMLSLLNCEEKVLASLFYYNYDWVDFF